MWYQMLVYYFQKEFETKFLDGPYYPKRKIYIGKLMVHITPDTTVMSMEKFSNTEK